MGQRKEEFDFTVGLTNAEVKKLCRLAGADFKVLSKDGIWCHEEDAVWEKVDPVFQKLVIKMLRELK